MTRHRAPYPILENVTITGVAAEGKALARVNDMVVFVPFAVPGDVVDLQVRKKKHSYWEAEVVRFVKYSDVRAVPRCSHFGVCGGCKWQNLPYGEQLKAKQAQVVDQLTRIGKLELPDISPILGSEKIWEYRNKLEFGCSDKLWLTKEQIASGEEFGDMNGIGFHVTGSFEKILPIEKCYLMDGLQNEIRGEIRDFALANGLTFYNAKGHYGFLRGVMVRNGNMGEWMVLVQFHFDESQGNDQAMALLSHLGNKFQQVTSLLYVDNQKFNDTFGDLDIQVFKGNDHIFETMEGLRFKVGAKSFYQTNTDQAYNLYRVARDLAALTGNELVYDLYTGTGTIANFVAKGARAVIGIEYVREAIDDARENSDINGITNTEFFAGDMKDVLTRDFINEHGKPDVMIVDPPRAGMHQDVVNTILGAQPERIVYVSCNPATQARDMALMSEAYRVVAVQPVDMFPHTPHVENVVLLQRKRQYDG